MAALELATKLSHLTTFSISDIRNELVPLNKQYPLAELMEACRAYNSNRRKRIMFEYVMLKVL